MTSARPPFRWRHLLADLKRRQVFRAMAFYGTSAFVVMQAADLVLPRLSLPDWTVTLIVVLALLGFPVAIVIAWSFESGANGVRRAEVASADELDAIVAQPRSRRWLAGVTALVGLILLATGAWLTLGRSDSYRSIAVLPFANLSGQPENEYFGDGLADELIMALAGIEGLRVPARTSSFAFKGTNTDARVIGDTLNVDAVLESTVNRTAENIRITVRLIDARNGSIVWSQSYNRLLAELASLQQTMAAQIVDELALRLRGGEKENLYRGGTKDVVAYDLYLKGRQKWTTRNRDLLREALKHFDDAIARDSAFALAWSGRADALDALAYRAPEFRARVPEAKESALRAILLEPELAEGWASLGVLLDDFDWNWKLAEQALRRAVQLKPGYAQAHSWLGDVLRHAGWPAEAVQHAAKAAELNPREPRALNTQAQTLSHAERSAEVHELYLRANNVSAPVNRPPMIGMVIHAKLFGASADQAAEYARAYGKAIAYPKADELAIVGRAVVDQTRKTEAHAAIQRMASSPAIVNRETALLAASIGDYEISIRALQRSLDAREGVYPYGLEPVFDPMRKDPRFIRILQQFNMRNCDAACRAADKPRMQ